MVPVRRLWLRSKHPVGEGRTALVDAELEEVIEQVDLRRHHVQIHHKVGGRSDPATIAPFMPAEHVVMVERIYLAAATSP